MPIPVPAHHAQVGAVLVLADHVPDAAERGPRILVDGGPHVGGGRLPLAWMGRALGSVQTPPKCTLQCQVTTSHGHPEHPVLPLQLPPGGTVC